MRHAALGGGSGGRERRVPTPCATTRRPARGITTLTGRTCWGASTEGDRACYKETRADTTDVGFTVVSRGWADLGEHAGTGTGEPLVPGERYTIGLDLAATDHVVPAGHRLALTVAGTDRGLVDPPADTPTLTLDLARTSAEVPFTGGRTAFARATAGPYTTAEPTVLDGVDRPDASARRVPGEVR